MLLLNSHRFGAVAAGITEVGGISQRATARNGSAATSLALAFPANVGSGNLIVVGGSAFDQNVTGVTDTRGTTYTLHVFTLGTTRIFIAYGFAPSGGANTVTVSGGNTYFSYSITEFSGVNATPLNVLGTALEQASTATPTTPAITTTVSGALMLSVMQRPGTGAITPSAELEQIGEEEDQSLYVAHNFAYRILGAPGNYTASWSLAAATSTRCVALALAPA